MGDATLQRDEVSWLAAVDWSRALTIAEGIAEPWFRVQSLTCCAKHAPDDRTALNLIERAWSTARSQPDRYRAYAVTPWIVEAATRRGMRATAVEIVQTVLDQRGSITPSKSRCRALTGLWHASIPLGPDVSDPVLRASAEAAFELIGASHRRPRGIGKSEFASIILTAVTCAPSVATELLAACPDQPLAKRIRARIAEGEMYLPRLSW